MKDTCAYYTIYYITLTITLTKCLEREEIVGHNTDSRETDYKY